MTSQHTITKQLNGKKITKHNNIHRKFKVKYSNKAKATATIRPKWLKLFVFLSGVQFACNHLTFHEPFFDSYAQHAHMEHEQYY